MSQLPFTPLHETARGETILAEPTLLTSRSVRATITGRAAASATARSRIQVESDQGTWHGRAGSGTRDFGRVVMVVDHTAVVLEASTTPPCARLEAQVGPQAVDQEQR